MKNKCALVLVIDRLGAPYVGPYGNTWLDTPQLNRLAAESFLVEHAMIDSPRLDMAYRSYWHGVHAGSNVEAFSTKSLPRTLSDQGIECILVSDEPAVQQFDSANLFSVREISVGLRDQLADNFESTHLAQMFSETIECLQNSSLPFCMWVHGRGMAGPWDAPYELRAQFADEEDPAPPDFVEPPALRIDRNADPDELLGLTHAYAGQVALLDLCIGALLDVVTSVATDCELLLVVTSARGFPLGEHGRIGSCDEALFEELLHVPLLIRFPSGEFASHRTQAFVQPPDLFSTLLDWFEIESNSNDCSRSLLAGAQRIRTPPGDRACCVGDGQFGFRTPAWYLRRTDEHHQLFVKPDDRWEVNDVAERCDDVVKKMGEYLDEFLQTMHSPQLPEVLISGLD